jgi:hypothetical protein
MAHNASIQKLNNIPPTALETSIQNNGDDEEDNEDAVNNINEESILQNNRCITPVMLKGFQIKDVSPLIASRNKSYQRLGAMS